MKPLCFLCVLLFLTACKSTVHRVNDLSPGMTKAQVIEVLGPPQSSMSPGNGIEILKFKLTQQRLYRLAVPLNTEYHVRFVDGRVDAYGTPRDLARAGAASRQDNKTVNVNIKSDSPTAVQPIIQP